MNIDFFDKTEKATCILCGSELKELQNPIEVRCDVCGKVHTTHYQCDNSHYICDNCLAMPVNEFIKNKCLEYKDIDPMALAVSIMNSPKIRIFGPEHHLILPAVMLTCVYNLQHTHRDKEELLTILEETENRVENQSPRECAYHLGGCGAAIGTGIFASIFLGKSLSKDETWSVANSLVADSLKRIAEAGAPRCCKRDTYISIETSVDFLKNRYNIELPITQGRCTFSLRNSSCKREECYFYDIRYSLV